MLKFPEEHKNFLHSFKKLAKIHKLIFNANQTDEEIEECASLCENFLEFYTVMFPYYDLTRKMFVLGMILPIFLRKEKQNMYKFLCAEEKGESLHKLFNEFERQFCTMAYKPARYLSMKKAYITRINLDAED